MRYAIAAIASLALVACSSVQPMAVRPGDVCFRCKRVITDTRLAAELVRTTGQASAFRTPGCLAKYLVDNPDDIKTIFVTDYHTGKMIPVTSAMFVRTTIDEKTGERDFYAFRSISEAAKYAKETYGAVVDWAGVRTLVAPSRTAN